MTKFILSVVLLLLAATPSSPQEALIPDPEAQIELSKYTCAQHVRLVDEEDGRSDVRTVWAHGYSSALKGIDETTGAFSVAEGVEFGTKLLEHCRANPNKLWIVAVKEIK